MAAVLPVPDPEQRPVLLLRHRNWVDALAQRYEVHEAHGLHWDAAVRQVGPRVRAVVTNGGAGLSEAEMAALPALELVACAGTGTENVDVDAARRRGLAITYGRGTNAEAVADHALALLLAAARQVPQADAALRRRERPRWTPWLVHGKRIGIVGLGAIGRGVARRLAGFDADIAYYGPRRKSDVDYAYFGDVHALAQRSDALVLACPGGAATRHLVDAAVLRALGPRGLLVNVSRGSVVDTAALLDALGTGALGAAALDVIEQEPDIPDAALHLPTLVLTPHIAAQSPETDAAALRLLLANLDAHFAGRPTPSPLP